MKVLRLYQYSRFIGVCALYSWIKTIGQFDAENRKMPWRVIEMVGFQDWGSVCLPPSHALIWVLEMGIMPSALPSHPPLHISIVFCPGQLSCCFSDACSASLPLWLQLALFLALACLTEISSSLSNQMLLSQRDLACPLYLMTDLHSHHLALSSPRSISSWQGPLWVTCSLFPPRQPHECKSKRGLCLFSELF